MQPAENDRYRPEYKIDGISDEVGDQLDELGKHHPSCERIAGNPRLIPGPVRGSLPQAQPEQDVADECGWRQGSQLHRIRAVELRSGKGRDCQRQELSEARSNCTPRTRLTSKCIVQQTCWSNCSASCCVPIVDTVSRILGYPPEWSGPRSWDGIACKPRDHVRPSIAKGSCRHQR